MRWCFPMSRSVVESVQVFVSAAHLHQVPPPVVVAVVVVVEHPLLLEEQAFVKV